MNKPHLSRFSSYLKLDLDYFLAGGFWIGLSVIFSIIAGFFLSSMFAKIWPAEIFGQYIYLSSITMFLSTITLPGLGQIVLQSSAENKDAIYKQSLKSMALGSIPGILVLLGFSLYFFNLEQFELFKSFLCLAILFPLINALGLYNVFLNGKKRFKIVSILAIISQLFTIGATFLALFFTQELFLVILAGFGTTAIINIIYTIYSFRFIKNKTKDNKLTKFGLHLNISQAFVLGADYLDRLIIPILLGFSNNAIYAFALLIPNQMFSFFRIFLTLGQPKIANIPTPQLLKGLIQKSIQLELLIILIICLYILISPYLYFVFFPQYQTTSTNLSQFLALSLLYYPSNLFGLTLVKERRSKDIYITNLFYFVATLLTLILLIPTFGLWGAVYAKVITRFAYGLLQFLLAYRFLSYQGKNFK